jgi:iron complex outermembrane receptor protein
MVKTNSYIKFREAALTYTFPDRFSKQLKLQKLMVGITARNLFYIYKSIPNIDAESLLSTSGWIENSNFPSARTYGFKVNISF